MNNDFKVLFEHSMNRFTYGGVQIGDYVNIRSTDFIGANDAIKKELGRIKSEDLNIKVLQIVKSTPENGENDPKLFSAVIGQEIAGGIFPQKYTVPVENLEFVSWNVPDKVPDSWKVDNKEDRDGKPEVLDLIGSDKEAKRNTPQPKIEKTY